MYYSVTLLQAFYSPARYPATLGVIFGGITQACLCLLLLVPLMAGFYFDFYRLFLEF